MDKRQQQEPFKRLGEKLKTIRQKLHESVAEVSGAVEIDEHALQRIEQGHERPSEDILMLLISHFGMQDEEATGLWKLAGYTHTHTNDTYGGSEDNTAARAAILVVAADSRVIYTDGVQVSANGAGVVMSFSQNNGVLTPLTTTRIGMSREQAQAVLRTLQEALTRSAPRQLTDGTGSKASDSKPDKRNEAAHD